MITPLLLPMPKIPIFGRSFLVLLIAATTSVAYAETITEADVIRIARTRDPDVLAAHESTSVAEAEEIRAELYPNPSIGWERESSPGRVTGREIEDSLFLTLPIDFTGRRPAQKALARSGASVARARAARTQSEAVTAALDAFYEAIGSNRDVQILTQAVTRLEEAARVVRRRHEEGTTSGYERTRLELEAELARSRLRQAETRARTARATLTVLLGVDAATLELRGDFATADPAPASSASSTRERPLILHLRASEAEARDAHSAAGWAWIPTLSLSGGLRISEAMESRYGYVAGASLSIPIFSWGEELRAESSARQRLAAAETRAAQRVTRVEEVRAREQLTSARAEITRFTEATVDRVELLERAVGSGYREGDLSVVELVDAQRARTDVERRQLELELIAKQAEIDLRAARGEFE